MAAATANRSRILDWLKVRLALRNMNRMSRTSAALFEPGVETLTVEEHDRRNAFNRLAKMEELGLLTQHGPDFPHNRTHTRSHRQTHKRFRPNESSRRRSPVISRNEMRQ